MALGQNHSFGLMFRCCVPLRSYSTSTLISLSKMGIMFYKAIVRILNDTHIYICVRIYTQSTMSMCGGTAGHLVTLVVVLEVVTVTACPAMNTLLLLSGL